MGIELHWQAETEGGEWETVAMVTIRPPIVIPRWVWVALPLTLVVVTAGIVGLLRYRYARALQRITFHIQSAIDLEARALEQRDVELFMAQQDEAAPDWYAQQQFRAHASLLQCGADHADEQTRVARDMPPQACATVGPAQVQKVELAGEFAWVEVVSGDGARRQAHFYRQTDRGWIRTAPRVQFWGDPVRLVYDGVVVHAHERDVPYIASLVDHGAEVMSGVQAALGSDPVLALEIHFLARVAPYEVPGALGTALVLPSPWLSGIPVAGQWDKEYLAEITYWTAYSAAVQYLRRPLGMTSGALRLDPSRQAILDEYALRYSRGDVVLPPTLQEGGERHGLDSLTEALRSILMQKR